MKSVIILSERCNGWYSKERISSRITKRQFLVCIHPSAWKTAQGTVPNRWKIEEQCFFEKRNFCSCTSKSTIRAWKRFCEIYLPVYIVHCNYNLYLFVIDTFIGRLLLLVASVISQAQISETGESCETLSFRGFVAYPHYRCIIYFLRFSPLYTRYCCDRPIVQDVYRIIEVHRG